ncbi:hypothetical protein ACFZCY_34585, partial [Streptomyces sp. NPDC007983]|uniref:hypothetical protein n=1 Tax=Streptomyces sp. NPDC007983 TaxID=3364800 RepID=UPI0036E4411E
MRNNVRRSILVAAAATGIWALGSAAANAAETPSVPSTDNVTSTVGGVTQKVTDTTRKVTETTDKVTDTTGKVTDTVDGATGDVADTSKVNDTAKKTVDGVTGTVNDTVDGAAKGQLPDVSKTTRDVTGGALDGVTRDAKPGKVVKKAHHAVKSVQKAADVDLPTGEVPGVVPHLPGLGSLPVNGSSLPAAAPVPTIKGAPAEVPAQLPAAPKLPGAPGAADNLLASLSGAGVRPEELAGKAKGTVGIAKPVVNGVADDVLPPAVNRVVVRVVPVAQGTLDDAGVLAGDAAGKTVPYVGYVVGSAQGYTLGTASNVLPFAQDTVANAVPFVQGTVANAVPVARNTVNNTVPFAADLATTTVPFALDLTGSVATNAQGTAVNTVARVQSLLPVAPVDLTDAANIPALPALPQVPAQLP